jgi:predicted transcriptional regulator
MNNETKQTYYQKNKDRILKKQQDNRDSKYIGMVEGYDYICCKECGFRSSELATHIIRKHEMTVLEYKDKHNVSTIKSQSSIDRVKGDKW